MERILSEIIENHWKCSKIYGNYSKLLRNLQKFSKSSLIIQNHQKSSETQRKLRKDFERVS